jgi:hypothetical protein
MQQTISSIPKDVETIIDSLTKKQSLEFSVQVLDALIESIHKKFLSGATSKQEMDLSYLAISFDELKSSIEGLYEK